MCVCARARKDGVGAGSVVQPVVVVVVVRSSALVGLGESF